MCGPPNERMLKFALKSTADCWVYLAGIGPDGLARLWFPLPGQENRVTADSKILFPGPGETVSLDGPAGTYQLKLLAVRRPLAPTDFEDGIPPPDTMRRLLPEDWAEQSVSFQLVE